MTEPTADQAETAASGDLFALAYDELKRLAHHARRERRSYETLDTTALVHETYLKIGAHELAAGKEPGYLRALAARAMRQILVDRARRRMAEKRGAGAAQVTLNGLEPDGSAQPFDLVAVDAALTRLEALDARFAQVVELHVFAGMPIVQIATQLGLSERTVFRNWRAARAFLIGQLAASSIG
ncbi:ECF-type sigma factor [Tahibacter sp.]|uniref:ECF-type sigma factor n=1 Tax=Tahibacter sp. TaxID=2056211 RepID=UPI0028C37E72|nr:ECF-type sigma factor [Tahibacter sp.]